MWGEIACNTSQYKSPCCCLVLRFEVQRQEKKDTFNKETYIKRQLIAQCVAEVNLNRRVGESSAMMAEFPFWTSTA